MRSSYPPLPERPRGPFVALALVAAAFPLVAACGDEPSNDVGVAHDHAGHAGAVGRVAGLPDAVIAGPQGAVGQFVVECGYSHAAQDDPIVFPGRSGASHLHVFFGNTTVDASSTIATLRGAPTTCEQQLDHAAYWAPALFAGDEFVEPVTSTAYYRAGIGVDPATVVPFPEGLAMVAGDASAVSPQPLEIVAWTCGSGIERTPTPSECAADTGLRLLVTFPDCWDGERLDSADHAAHVAYSSAGRCPSTHPVSVPQLQFAVDYGWTGPTDALRLASGSVLTGHADFVNAWEPAKLADEVALCLGRGVVCGVTSGRGSP
jgi:hypothetical protein